MEHLQSHLDLLYTALTILIAVFTVCKLVFYTKDEINNKLHNLQEETTSLGKSINKNHNNLMIRMIEEVNKIKDEIYRDLDEKASKKDMERLESKLDSKADKEDVSKLETKMDRMTDIMIELKTIISLGNKTPEKD